MNTVLQKYGGASQGDMLITCATIAQSYLLLITSPMIGISGIVSYVIRDKNNNALVFDTVDNALLRNPGAQPLFHSDRGFQYTNRTFHTKLVNAGIIQSMSRVAKCIDNGPMEGFWGILKRERYYGKRFTDRGTLVKMIEDYIDYYNNKRLQRNLGILTPMEKHEIYLQAA